ncbi:hypothetical protein [Spirosoma foliorum]|uniref:Uncharacterized protein n=1 Tax=Spirosoma foliorum TaxID=2710596 RepID=A0A7G5GXZ2_9BACT|nr:hypothetical protein [Spirosoma foliorum]QMW03734.1 hypothetical protein H3H32_01900 [Spirosoma foliorum]
MKPKSPKLIEEIDVEVVNRQPNATERQEISAFIRSYKTKTKGVAPTASILPR